MSTPTPHIILAPQEISPATLNQHLSSEGACLGIRFRYLDTVPELASILASISAKPMTVAVGLQELLTNAIEHGTVDITHAEKIQLRNEDRWEEEILRRLAHKDYASRQVFVLIERFSTKVIYYICDSGKGFDWARFMDFDPERACDLSGRGVAIANHLSFDKLEYRKNGTVAVATALLKLDPA